MEKECYEKSFKITRTTSALTVEYNVSNYCTLRGNAQRNNNQKSFNKCVDFPISCPTIVGMHEKIQCKNLADHQKVCSLEPVKCPFFELSWVYKNDSMKISGSTSNTEHHLELVMTETVTLKHKATNLEQKATCMVIAEG